MLKKRILLCVTFYTLMCWTHENPYSLLLSVDNTSDDSQLLKQISFLETCLTDSVSNDIHILYDCSKDDDTNKLLYYLHARPVNIYYCNGKMPLVALALIGQKICDHPNNLKLVCSSNQNGEINSFFIKKNGLRLLPSVSAVDSDLSFIQSKTENKKDKHPAYVQLINHCFDNIVFINAKNSHKDTQTHQPSSILEILTDLQKKDFPAPTIIIDDLRLFYEPLAPTKNTLLETVPPLCQIIEACLRINPEYKVICVHDTLIAFKNASISVSPLVRACTISRLYDGTNFTIEEVIKAEIIIGNAQSHEKETLEDLADHYTEPWGKKIGLSRHYPLWKGLMFLSAKNYQAAYEQFQKAQDRGLTHWRISWYMNMAESKLKDK